MAKRKSCTQLTDQTASPSNPSNNPPRKSTLIDSLNALSPATFTSRFLANNPTKTSHDGHNNNNDDNDNDTRTWTTALYFASLLPPSLLNQCFTLIETTSRQDYASSSLGWHPARKKREMQEPEMRYLLLYETSTFGGFVSFMFTHDSHPVVPVLYIYEIHLEDGVRGRGLGAFLVGRMEDVARMARVEKVMLTCFASNSHALGFYRKLGFEMDGCSPGERRTRRKVVRADYVILSKAVDGDGGG